MWELFNGGKTRGQRGSENGTIVLDEEIPNTARITLERGATTAPFAITCGIYYRLVHTCFLGDESKALAQYESMKSDLAAVLEMMPEAADPDYGAKRERADEAVARFVSQYPP